METEKRIVFNSSVENVNICNQLAHFQNSLFSKNYLDPYKNYAITPRQLYIDLNFKNPVCPVDNAFPSVICVPKAHYGKKLQEQADAGYPEGSGGVKLHMFYNVHKFYLNTGKKYTISDLFDEWTLKERIGIETKKKYNDKHSDSLVYKEKDLILTTTFLKKDSKSIIFGQHPIIEDPATAYNVKVAEEERTLLFFHYKFIEKLGIRNQVRFDTLISGEKYYMVRPFFGSSSSPKTVRVDLDNQGLLFETPKILQIKCDNIKSYPFNSSFTKTIGVVNLKENNTNSSFHHTFKGNQFYPVESKINETWEILITDENNSRLKLYEGIPTILEISAIEDKMENELNVTCNSEISEFHPKNCPTNFTTVLNTPIKIDRDWKVALSSITFKNNFKFDSSFDFRFSYWQYNKKNKEILKRTNIKIDENVTTVKEIFESFKSILKKHKVDEDSQSPNGPDGTSRKTRSPRNKKIANVDLSENQIMTFVFPRATKLSLSPHLAMVLGANNNPFERNNKEWVDIEVGNNPDSNDEHTGGTSTASIPIDFNLNLKQKFMFVEMSAIKNVPIGNGNGKVLKIIPLSLDSYGQYVTQDFDILDYHPLAYHHLHNIEFKLLSHTGSTLKYHKKDDNSINNYDITWIQLIFKKFPKNDEDEPPLKRAKFN